MENDEKERSADKASGFNILQRVRAFLNFCASPERRQTGL